MQHARPAQFVTQQPPPETNLACMPRMRTTSVLAESNPAVARISRGVNQMAEKTLGSSLSQTLLLMRLRHHPFRRLHSAIPAQWRIQCTSRPKYSKGPRLHVQQPHWIESRNL